MMMMMCKFVVFYICFFFHLPSSIIIISISILCDLLFSWFQWKHFETHTSSARVWYFLFFFISFVSYKCMCSAHTHTYRTFTIGFVTNLTIKQSCLEKKNANRNYARNGTLWSIRILVYAEFLLFILANVASEVDLISEAKRSENIEEKK